MVLLHTYCEHTALGILVPCLVCLKHFHIVICIVISEREKSESEAASGNLCNHAYM